MLQPISEPESMEKKFSISWETCASFSYVGYNKVNHRKICRICYENRSLFGRTIHCKVRSVFSQGKRVGADSGILTSNLDPGNLAESKDSNDCGTDSSNVPRSHNDSSE